MDENEKELLLADGFDAAFLGIGRRCGQPDIAVYDRTRCLQILVAQGATADEAIKYFEFNVVGAWVGECTPLFLDAMSLEEARQRLEEG